MNDSGVDRASPRFPVSDSSSVKLVRDYKLALSYFQACLVNLAIITNFDTTPERVVSQRTGSVAPSHELGVFGIDCGAFMNA